MLAKPTCELFQDSFNRISHLLLHFILRHQKFKKQQPTHNLFTTINQAQILVNVEVQQFSSSSVHSRVQEITDRDK